MMTWQEKGIKETSGKRGKRKDDMKKKTVHKTNDFTKHLRGK